MLVPGKPRACFSSRLNVVLVRLSSFLPAALLHVEVMEGFGVFNLPLCLIYVIPGAGIRKQTQAPSSPSSILDQFLRFNRVSLRKPSMNRQAPFLTCVVVHGGRLFSCLCDVRSSVVCCATRPACNWCVERREGASEVSFMMVK